MSIPDGADLTDIGYLPIEATTPPTPPAGQQVVMGEPEEYAPNQWRETYILAPLPIAPLAPRQIRLALTQLGLRDHVEQAVAAGDANLRDWWQYSLEYRRDHPLVEQMIQDLGVTAQQADDLWRLGATL